MSTFIICFDGFFNIVQKGRIYDTPVFDKTNDALWNYFKSNTIPSSIAETWKGCIQTRVGECQRPYESLHGMYLYHNFDILPLVRMLGQVPGLKLKIPDRPALPDALVPSLKRLLRRETPSLIDYVAAHPDEFDYIQYDYQGPNHDSDPYGLDDSLGHNWYLRVGFNKDRAPQWVEDFFEGDLRADFYNAEGSPIPQPPYEDNYALAAPLPAVDYLGWNMPGFESILFHISYQNGGKTLLLDFWYVHE